MSVKLQAKITSVARERWSDGSMHHVIIARFMHLDKVLKFECASKPIFDDLEGSGSEPVWLEIANGVIFGAQAEP